MFGLKNHRIHQSAIVPYRAKQMFDLVNNIEQYPKFLSWCRQSHILSQSDAQIIASLTIAKSVFSNCFTTINTLTLNEKIEIKLKSGPFRNMNAIWLFKALNDESCCVDFKIDFSFDNKLLDISLSPIFTQIVNTQLDAFIKRAKQVYD